MNALVSNRGKSAHINPPRWLWRPRLCARPRSSAVAASTRRSPSPSAWSPPPCSAPSLASFSGGSESSNRKEKIIRLMITGSPLFYRFRFSGRARPSPNWLPRSLLVSQVISERVEGTLHSFKDPAMAIHKDHKKSESNDKELYYGLNGTPWKFWHHPTLNILTDRQTNGPTTIFPEFWNRPA